jgi:hypothetical protein
MTRAIAFLAAWQLWALVEHPIASLVFVSSVAIWSLWPRQYGRIRVRQHVDLCPVSTACDPNEPCEDCPALCGRIR